MRTLTSLVLAVGLLACHEKQELTAPPPPLRPEAEPAVKRAVAAKDCEPIDSAHEMARISFGERSIPEGTRLSDEGRTNLKAAESAEVDRSTREAYIAEAVKNFITALAADPYNIAATYNLAAAYARINRPQCSLNLLGRVLQMRKHPSKRAEVELHLDKLLGRKQPLDPNFADLRLDERFRSMISDMCKQTNSPDCVYGGQKTDRER